jgi:mono/diheme cytochrome c family protein
MSDSVLVLERKLLRATPGLARAGGQDHARPRARWTLPAAVVASWLLLGCAATQQGASDATLARAKTVASRGSAVYAASCAKCHGGRGEGSASAPPLMGEGALPLYPRDSQLSSTGTTDPQQLQLMSQGRPPGVQSREPFHTAQDVFDYSSTHMPKDKPGSLSPPEYWDVVTFLLVGHGGKVPEGGVNASNASDLPI